MKSALRKVVSLLLFVLTTTIGVLTAQPTFTSNPVTTATVGSQYVYGVAATDPSNNVLNFSAITKPAWLTLNNNGQSSATQFGGTIPQPGGISGDDAGNIYVTSLTTATIYKITPDGTTTSWFTRQGGNVYGMYVYNNILYVSYYYNSTTGRSKITKIDIANPAAGETDVYVNPTNNYVYLSMTYRAGFLYVAAYGQSKIIRINLSNNAISDVVTVSSPFGVGFNSQGILYIASYGMGAIYTYNLTTSVLTQVVTGLQSPSDVKIDAYDNVYVSGYQFVRKYTPTLSSFITAYTAPSYVWGMSITPTGALVFGDNGANRVAKLQTGASLTGTPALADTGVHNITLRVSNGSATTDQNYAITVYSAPTIAAMANVSRPLNQGPVTITNPISNSNGAFTYTSSNPAVASVSGNSITLNTQGTTTITATQAALGYFNAGTRTFTLTVTAPVTTGPAGINNGIKMWLDASDIDGDGNAGNDPSNNGLLTIWKDKSGSANHATTIAGKNGINYVTNQINGKAVARFTKVDDVQGSVMEVNGLDIRAGANPAVTMFTVYKSGAHPVVTGQGQALWGNDDGAWDRFFYSSWSFTDDGIVSLGPVNPTFTNVTGSGTVGATRLLTAVYNNGVVNGSNIYFNGAVVNTFTDNTSPTAAKPVLGIGWDGDNGVFNGDIAEMIVYNRKLTDCEILTINQYLGAKYGVTFTSATITPAGPTTVCAGTPVSLTASAGNSYQWYKDNVLIPGANAATYNATSPGSYTVNITSAAGCTASSAPVVVTVNSLPTATVVKADVSCSGLNNGTITITANGGSAPYQYSINGGSSFVTTNSFTGLAAGNYNVIVKSAAGCNSVSQVITVAVTPDLTAPVPTVATLPDITGQCSVTVSAIPTATDNCSGVLNATTTSALTYTSQGTYTITWKYTDAAGNESTQTQNVIVSDNTAPVADVTSLPTITAQCGITVTTIPTATDNCSGVINATTTSALTYTTQGTYTITWTYTDAAGNESTQTQNVIVSDNTAPVADVTSLPTITAQCGITVTTIPTATDNCSGVINATTTSALTYTTQGTYTITWKYTDAAGNESTQTQNVIVSDNTAPVADVTSLPTITGQCGVTVTTVPTATDNCSGVINATTTSALTYTTQGTHTITWTYTDAVGNVSTQTQTVIILDNIAPVANVATLPDITAQCGITVTTIPTATDNCSGVINATTTSALTYTTQGTYTIVWRYTDAAGNVSTQTQKVIILDNTAPVPNVATLPDLTGECNVTVNSIPTATDNCYGVLNATTTSPLSYSSQGTYTITWRYTDAAGNFTTQTQTVIVKDVTPPVVTCPAPVTVTAPSNQCGAVVNYSQPTVTDNCSSGSTGVHTLTSGAQFFDYANNVNETQYSPGLPMSFFPTDGQKLAVFLVSCGTTHYMYQNVTLPSSGPITLGFDMKYTNHFASGFSTNQFIAVELRNPTTNALITTLFKTNPGAPLSTPMTHYNFDLSAYAGQQVRLQVLDATINNFYLDVQLDNITIPGSSLVNGSFETGNYNGWTIGSASGGCGTFGIGSGPSVTIAQTAGLPSGSTFPIGITTNTFEVTDLAGNKTTCSFNVTVNAPEINITGNGATIVTGDNTPSTTDNTDLGGTIPGSSISKTFVIANNGTSTLTINSINISNAAFSRSGISLPASVLPGQTASFTISFASTALGVQNALVTVSNNDCNEGSYNFTVKAEVTCTNPVFVNTSTQVQANTTATTCNTVVNYPLGVTGIPAPNVSYVFSGATTGNGTGTGSGQTFNKGTTHVVVTAINPCNTVINEFDVIVSDITLPTAVAQNLTVNLDATGAASITAAQVNNGSSDNCGIASISINKTSFDCSNVGANTVTLTVTDVNGNSSTATAIVTVVDNINPTAVAQNITVNLDATGAASITAAQVNNGSSDNCGIASISVNKTSFDCSNVGANTVTLTVTDVNGNVSTATATVTVVDNINPTAVAQNITVNLDAAGAASITAAQVNNGSSDNCGIASISINKTSFDCSNVGANTVTLTVTDVNGNVSTATTTVTVVDNINPTAVAQNITVNLDATGAASITAAQVNNGSSDNCGIASISVNKTSFDCSNVGVNTVTLTVTDVNGNVSTATAVVTVVDNIAPSITASAMVSVVNTPGLCTAIVDLGTPVTSDNCGIATITNNAPALFPVGTTIVRWTVTDVHGNITDTATQMVVVIDNELPTISVNNISVNNDAGKCGATVNISLPQTADNCGVATLMGIRSDNKLLSEDYPVGTTTITWTVKDIHGNIKVVVQTVVVTDNEKPTITAPAMVSVVNTPGTCATAVNLGTPVTADNCGVATVTNNAPALFPVGTTVVTWTVTDIHGNVNDTATQTVVVIDNELPTISVNNISVNNDAGKCGATVVISQPQTADNCGVATVMGVRSDNKLLTEDYPVGTTTITWTVRDVNGNMKTATQTVVVTDNEKPVIVCAANQVFCANTGGNTQYSIPALNQSDNCGIASTTYTVTGATNRTGTGTNASGSFAIGSSTVSFTVTDIHGNVSTCSFTVRINPLPVASITAATANALCNQFTLTANSSLSGPYSYQWLYNNNTKATTQQLSLGLTDADGVYSVYTTDANGCRSEQPATYNYQKQNLVNSYTILGLKEVKLGQYDRVETGSVGVMSSRGEAEFDKYSSVTGAGSFVKAPRIDTDRGVTINSKIYGVANVTLPTMQYNLSNTRYLQDKTVNSNVTTTINGNYDEVTLKKGSNVTLTGTVFGKIKLEEGASVRFTSTTIDVAEIQIEKGPKSGGYSYIRFAPNTSIRVSKKVTIGSDVIVNPEAYQVTFYMADNRRDEEKFHVKGDDTRITANIILPDGKLKVTGGNYGDDRCDHRPHSSKDCRHRGHGHHDCDHRGHGDRDCRDDVFMTGLFIAEEVQSEGKNVIWNSYNCAAPSAPVTTLTSNNNQASVTEEVAASSKLQATSKTEEELKVTVMPNPTRTYFTLKLESKHDAPVTLRVVDAAGRVVDSRTKIGSNSTIQIGHNYQTGNYFAELVQGTRRKVIQLIKVR